MMLLEVVKENTSIGRGITMALIDSPGGRVRLARTERGLKSGEIVEELNRRGHAISPSHYSNVEGGKRELAPDLAQALAGILDMTLDEIYGRETSDIGDSEFGELSDLFADADAPTRRILLAVTRFIAGSADEVRRQMNNTIDDMATMEPAERDLFVQTCALIADMDSDSTALLSHMARVLHKIDSERRQLMVENRSLLMSRLSGAPGTSDN